MAKGKGKKGGKGDKKGAKGKEEVPPDPNALTEVDKTFYELQLADVNRKLARLRTLSDELEVKNEELQAELKTMDEDRADIISYLNRTLQEKCDDIADLNNRLVALQETREEEAEDFRNQIVDMKEEYRMMQEQLSSEIKLLNGKLNSLDEYRIQRDDLMQRYEIQEKAMEEQELRHKREIYEIEKKFIIGKDRLKKEMEEKLLQLSCDFQDATNLRIAATTHKVIRENITINNELDVILATHNRLHTENEELKERDHILRMEADLHQSEKNKALAKSAVQYQLISKMTIEHEKLMQQLEHYKGIEKELSSAKIKILESERSVEYYIQRCKILEQNLHLSRCDRVCLRTDVSYAQGEVDRLTEILVHAVMCIKQALNLEQDQAAQVAQSRDDLLQTLLEVLGKVYELQPRKPSLSSVESFTAMYKKGDLGFVPIAVELRSKFPTKRNTYTEIGPSLEDMAAAYSELGIADKKDELTGEEQSEEGTEESSVHGKEVLSSVVEESSQVLFDDEPEAPSIDSERGAEINLLDLVPDAGGVAVAHGEDFDMGEHEEEEFGEKKPSQEGVPQGETHEAEEVAHEEGDTAQPETHEGDQETPQDASQDAPQDAPQDATQDAPQEG
nr:cilia- and flagella-associated protein 157 [Onthophagus taurus]